MAKYIHLYMESPPNPASMKYVTNVTLAPTGLDYHYDSVEAASGAPLAQMLFGFPFVDKVFLMSNFITVTKHSDYEWEDVNRVLRDAIQEYLEQERPILDVAALVPMPELSAEEETEVEAKIKSILDEYIRPAVEGDGGAINFHSFIADTGLVKVQLRGSCSGCPSSTVTLKNGIENLLTRMVPEVRAVEAEGV